jgi:hypothetical protein
VVLALLRALERELGTIVWVVLHCIADSRVQAADLVGLLVRVEVLHVERCGRVWKGVDLLENGKSRE